MCPHSKRPYYYILSLLPCPNKASVPSHRLSTLEILNRVANACQLQLPLPGSAAEAEATLCKQHFPSAASSSLGSKHQGCQGCWKAGGPERNPSVNMLFLSVLLSNSTSAWWQQLNPTGQVPLVLSPSTLRATFPVPAHKLHQLQALALTSDSQFHRASVQAPDPSTQAFECTPSQRAGPQRGGPPN